MVNDTIPLGYTLSPLKLTREVSNGRSLFWSSFNCWKVDDVYRASIVHEDSFGVEPLYIQHYDQRVIVGLSYSPGIDIVEGHILVHLSLFEWGYHVDAIHLTLACFLKGPE